MKKIFCLLFALIALFSLCACSGSSNTEKSDAMPDLVRMTVKDFGSVTIRLYPDKAPISVSNFKSLVYRGYYNGLTFHRIIEGFMIQGGDGDDVATIKGEFAENGVENTLLHQRGTISMARAENPNSASSQFFICQERYAYGDGKYAAFGEVVDGMEVVDAIAAVPTDYYDRPLTQVIIESIVFVTE